LFACSEHPKLAVLRNRLLAIQTKPMNGLLDTSNPTSEWSANKKLRIGLHRFPICP
jgi:hypothetical protein